MNKISEFVWKFWAFVMKFSGKVGFEMPLRNQNIHPLDINVYREFKRN